MTPREAGFLLLTSTLGDPARKILTDAQLRTLARRASLIQADDPDRQLTENDLLHIGYSLLESRRIADLLQAEEQLRWYLQKGERSHVYPITRVSSQYPKTLRHKLGLNCPGCLWAKGDVSLLDRKIVGLVGSRELNSANRAFAREVGKQAALQGYVLVSGNAHGADREAQNACLQYGGSVISVIADELTRQPHTEGVLYLSEGGYDLTFTAQRALHRNTVIHCLAQKLFVAQSTLNKGGTWNGTTENLRKNYSPVFCFSDGSQAAAALEDLGAVLITGDDLINISSLQADMNLFSK